MACERALIYVYPYFSSAVQAAQLSLYSRSGRDQELSSLRGKVEEGRKRIVEIRESYQNLRVVKNDLKRRYNATVTDYDDLKVAIDGLKTEQANLQRMLG